MKVKMNSEKVMSILGCEGEGWSSEDRSKWAEGPWDQEEEDALSWTDPLTGYDCSMKRNHSGAWCGYVAIPEGHPLCGVEYGETYYHEGVPSMGHAELTYSGWSEGGWVFGFDCNHYTDCAPTSTELTELLNGTVALFEGGKEVTSSSVTERYRTTAYVVGKVHEMSATLKRLRGKLLLEREANEC